MSDLASIRTFPQLVKYLRDELDWPITSDDFEDLTFDYTPKELGIDSKSAAKIQEIKRLRSLSMNQPWGVFFVKFEPKRLPIVALRRILSSVALKRRASANNADRKAWEAEDLLFISNYGGEGDGRQMTFAHFSQNPTKHDLPTLKVLGWDGLDTPLHIDHVADTLHDHLRWPTDEADTGEWRANWRRAFELGYGEVITTSRLLAIRLADLASEIRNRINTALEIETKEGPLTSLLRAFRESLVHDLDNDGFADMYAQTIAYGLLSARISNPKSESAEDLALQMPVTNPFLRELMETFLHVGGRRGDAMAGPSLDFDELGVSEVVELLDRANMEAVLRDFGDRNPQEDPVIHFYELFLKEYDPQEKVKRGVFYTPRPVVSYIVRSVHELLWSEFGLADGLADTSTWAEMSKRNEDFVIPEGVLPERAFIQILDPATGTGTFLVEVIDVIHNTLVAKWTSEGTLPEEIVELWNEYVPKYLLPRLHGFELLMAPYAIAHLKVGLKLHETGYRFANSERARIYLTNALEPFQDYSDRFTFAIPALAHEAQAVNAVKDRGGFTVVMGNPPYSGESANQGTWIRNLIGAYRTVAGAPLGEANPRWLQDDYVKFLRFAQLQIDRAGYGLVALITNHSYIDNPTFRGMRWSFTQSFDGMAILDLHGNTKKGEKTSLGLPDKNVFEIQQGVAIGIWSKSSRMRHAKSQRADLFGTREEKYEFLHTHSWMNTEWEEFTPNPPHYLFAPTDTDLQSEYSAFMPLSEIMPVHSNGIVTARDHLCICWTASEVWSKVSDLVELRPDAAREKFALGDDSRDWQVELAQQDLRKDGPKKSSIVPILYRPFDIRQTYFTGHSRGFLCMPRGQVMRNMFLDRNVGIITSRLTKGEHFAHVQATRRITEAIAMSPKTSNNGFLFPLFVLKSDSHDLFSEDRESSPNLASTFVKQLARSIGEPLDVNGVLPRETSAEDVLAFIYGILHSPSYRERYEHFLALDFPRLPSTPSQSLFRGLVDLGTELISLSLLEAPEQRGVSAVFEGTWHYKTEPGIELPVRISFVGPEKSRVGKVTWSDGAVSIDSAGGGSAGGSFRGVSQEVWNFHIGGYQVCLKWLKDRKGRVLTSDDITNYQRIVIAVHETIRIMDEVDEIISTHGGWPSAFLSGQPSAV